MPRRSLTSKGQVTVSKSIRTESSARGVCDRLVKPGVHASAQGMSQTVEESVARRFRRAVRRGGPR